MPFLSPTNCYCISATTNTNLLQWTHSSLTKRKYFGNNPLQKLKPLPSPRDNVVFYTRALARRKSMKKLRKNGDTEKNLALESTDNEKLLDSEGNFSKGVEDDSSSIDVASRGSVIQACVVTSGLIAALGIVIRQVSHVASVEGLPIIDCSSEVSFGFELWHIELITGLVILLSSCRYLLLKAWPDFAESSELANKQVLTSLELSDYVLVSLLPGVSEELLFHGALLPLFGMDWKSALLVAAIFGVLHLGGGRNSAFAIWATFVGLVYGYATIVSSSVVVPMAAHALNNMFGGILWRYSASNSSE